MRHHCIVMRSIPAIILLSRSGRDRFREPVARAAARAGEAAVAAAVAAHMRRLGLDVARAGGRAGTTECHRRARGRRARPLADVLRPHRHGRRRGDAGAVRPVDAGRPAVRTRRAGHEGRRRRDDRRGAGRARARILARAAHHRRRRRRGVREHRRGRARRASGAPTRRSSPSRPTCRSASAHKGFAWFEIETRGRAAHGSRPRDGRDAILRMGRVLRGSRSSTASCRRGRRIRVMGTASLHASIIDGGRELSSYPDRCRAADGAAHGCRAKRRSRRPAKIGDDPRRAARARIRSSRPTSRVDVLAAAVRDAAGHRAAEALGAARARAACRPRRVGMSFWTDAAVLGGAGMPSVLFGPGGAGLHSIEEYVTRRRRHRLPRRAGGAGGELDWSLSSSRSSRDGRSRYLTGDSSRRFRPSCAATELAARWPSRCRRGVALEAPPRSAPADFPARSVVAARRAAHHHPLALEVQHRVVAAEARRAAGPTARSPRATAPPARSNVTSAAAASCWG